MLESIYIRRETGRLIFFLSVFLLGVVSEVSSSTIFRGNTETMVYHHSQCRHFACKSCTETFASRIEAEEAGYRACRTCANYKSANRSIDKKSKPDPFQIDKKKSITNERLKDRETKKKSEELTISKALKNILKQLIICLLLEMILFILFNCFQRGKLGYKLTPNVKTEKQES